jgi:hypothetical protein
MSEPVYYKMCPECEQEIERANWPRHGQDDWKTNQRLREYLKVKHAAERSALFPAPLRTWNRHCPRHQAKLEGDVATIACNRFIPVEWFDVYDASGVHVCRACGARLLTKKGKPAAALRWCQAPDDGHYKLVLETLYDFASRRSWYVHDLATRQVPEMRAKHADKIATKELDFWGTARTASKNEHFTWRGQMAILCIFDPANFVALCSECHGKSHPWRKKPAPPIKPITTLDTFLSAGSNMDPRR